MQNSMRKLKLKLTLVLTLTDTGGAVLTVCQDTEVYTLHGNSGHFAIAGCHQRNVVTYG